VKPPHSGDFAPETGAIRQGELKCSRIFQIVHVRGGRTPQCRTNHSRGSRDSLKARHRRRNIDLLRPASSSGEQPECSVSEKAQGWRKRVLSRWRQRIQNPALEEGAAQGPARLSQRRHGRNVVILGFAEQGRQHLRLPSTKRKLQQQGLQHRACALEVHTREHLTFDVHAHVDSFTT